MQLISIQSAPSFFLWNSKKLDHFSPQKFAYSQSKCFSSLHSHTKAVCLRRHASRLALLCLIACFFLDWGPSSVSVLLLIRVCCGDGATETIPFRTECRARQSVCNFAAAAAAKRFGRRRLVF